MYGEGQGVAADPEIAREWLEKSAKNKNHEALFTLGLIYHQAMNVQQDYELAADYFRRAFIEGKSESASFLAEYYYQGNGVGQSRINAMMWLMLATEYNSTMPGGQLSQETLYRLDENKSFLTQELSPSEMGRAKERKDDFIKKNLES
ncbi:MAG: sel1 repeat family protein [Emcibacteraceae bacterium]|nr:sel1 repeat family protein [Emcibacteraceae bacterium]